MTRISVVIPVYNRVGLLPETLDSVLRQTHQDWECIVSDNCSTDGTYELALTYAQRDSRIRVVGNATNVGPVRNWLAGASHARSEWVKILFSDDVLHPEYLRKGVEAVERHADIGVVYFSFRDGLRISKPVVSAFELVMRAFLPGNSVSCSPSAYILRRDGIVNALNRRLISNPNLLNTGVGYDFACIFDSLAGRRKVAYVSERLVFYRSHGGSITSQIGADFLKLIHMYSDAYLELIAGSSFNSPQKFMMRHALRIRKQWYRFRV